MDAAYLSAMAALAGSTIGGVTSLGASWLSHHVQFSAQRRLTELARREELYGQFIDEASKWYVDAYANNQPAMQNLVKLYALVSKMRLLSSPAVVASADRVMSVIIETYLAPNKAFADVKELLKRDAVNPLREFGNTCREELLGSGASRDLL